MEHSSLNIHHCMMSGRGACMYVWGKRLSNGRCNGKYCVDLVTGCPHVWGHVIPTASEAVAR